MEDPNRKSVRKAFQVELQGQDADGIGQLWFETADLSTGGAFLKSDLLLEQGERLFLEFKLAQRVVKTEIRVAWVRRFPREGEPAGMGVQFVSMSEEDKALLARFIAEHH
jgi:uncharacterized protein (TIGR02266 family)